MRLEKEIIEGKFDIIHQSPALEADMLVKFIKWYSIFHSR